MNYVRDEDRPDYQHLQKMFSKLFRQQGWEYDNVFDRTIREFRKLEPDAQEPLASNDADETKATRRKRRYSQHGEPMQGLEFPTAFTSTTKEEFGLEKVTA